MGDQVSEDVIINRRGGMYFSMTVLRFKNAKKKNGVIDVYYMHSPFGNDVEIIETQIIDPFSKKVLIPYIDKNQVLPNFIFYNSNAYYLHKQYLRSRILIVKTVVSTIENTRDVVCKPNNQHSEGMFNN